MADRTSLVECFLKGNGLECLREGWSEIGVADTWTSGRGAALELPPTEAGTDYSLVLDIAGVAGPPGAEVQRLGVTVNDVHVAEVVCRGRQRLEFFVPGSILQPGRAVRVAFALPFACRPFDFGHNDDRRFLALRIASVSFVPLSPALSGSAQVWSGDLSAQREALLGIHSLGINCELGFMQRLAGVEPLALFRWTFAPLAKLVPAMEKGFEGLGAAGTLHIHVDAESEFIVRDSVYGFQYHSFVYASRGGTLEGVARNEYNRLTYLSRALVEELREAKKLFAYHDGGRSGLDEIRGLLRAMNRYGRNTLLWIMPASAAPDEPSTAREIEPGLIRACVSGFQLPVDQVLPVSPHQESWLKALMVAYQIWRSRT